MHFISPPEYTTTLCAYCGKYTRDYWMKEADEPVYCSQDCADTVVAWAEDHDIATPTPITDEVTHGDFEFRANDAVLDGHLQASEMLRALI